MLVSIFNVFIVFFKNNFYIIFLLLFLFLILFFLE